MPRAEVRRATPGRVRGPVVASDIKADRKRVDRLGRLRLHQRHNKRGIDPTRQERVKRHVRDHASLD
jgi:hypothetical protein